MKLTEQPKSDRQRVVDANAVEAVKLALPSMSLTSTLQITVTIMAWENWKEEQLAEGRDPWQYET